MFSSLRTFLSHTRSFSFPVCVMVRSMMPPHWFGASTSIWAKVAEIFPSILLHIAAMSTQWKGIPLYKYENSFALVDTQESTDNTLRIVALGYTWERDYCICHRVGTWSALPGNIRWGCPQWGVFLAMNPHWYLKLSDYFVFVRLLNGASFHGFGTFLFSVKCLSLTCIQFSISDLSFP